MIDRHQTSAFAPARRTSIGALAACGAFATIATIAACRSSGAPSTSDNARTIAPPFSSTAADAAKTAVLAPAASGLAAAGADAGSTGALAPLHWGTRPDPQAQFSYVIDGYCVQADVDLLDDATLVHYGEHGFGFAALATEAGLVDWERLSKGIDGYYLQQIQGSYPDNLWFGVDHGGRAYTSLHYLHFERDHWTPGFGATPLPERQHHALAIVPGGAVAAATSCTSDDACKEVGIVGQGVTAPQLGTNGFTTTRIVAIPGGELWAFGSGCTGEGNAERCTTQVRRAKSNGKIAVDFLATTAEPTSVIAKSATDVIVSFNEQRFRFVGDKWQPFTWSGKIQGGVLQAAPDGTLYALQNGKIERRAPDGVVTAIATPGPVTALEGVEVDARWIVFGDGNAARWDDATNAWVKVTPPRSPFAWGESTKNFPKVERIRVRSAKDVWLNVKYVEYPAHWGDQQYEERRALLRSIPPNETMRCRPEEKIAWESSPPLATAECTTPLVILATVDAAAKTDYPQTKRLLAGKKDLAGTRYLEFVIGKKKLVGARVPSYEIGKKLLAIMRAGIPYVRPEMVCADPSDAKELSFE